MEAHEMAPRTGAERRGKTRPALSDLLQRTLTRWSAGSLGCLPIGRRIDCAFSMRPAMPSASIELAKHVLTVFGLILAAGTAGAMLGQKLRIPDVAVFLLIGTLLGPDAVGLIDVKTDSAVNQLLLIFGS